MDQRITINNIEYFLLEAEPSQVIILSGVLQHLNFRYWGCILDRKTLTPGGILNMNVVQLEKSKLDENKVLQTVLERSTGNTCMIWYDKKYYAMTPYMYSDVEIERFKDAIATVNRERINHSYELLEKIFDVTKYNQNIVKCVRAFLNSNIDHTTACAMVDDIIDELEIVLFRFLKFEDATFCHNCAKEMKVLLEQKAIDELQTLIEN